MSTTPSRSTVVVHAITGDEHQVLAFTDVNLEFTQTDSSWIKSWEVCAPAAISDTVYKITGADGYKMATGGTIEEACARMIATQGRVVTAVRKERDEAIRERDEARHELIRMKERVRRAVDPPEPEPDEDDPDYCSCCDYYGEN